MGPKPRSFCPSGAGAHHSPSTWRRSPTQKFSESLYLGLPWRFPYIGMIKSIIGHQWLIQSPALLPSLECEAGRSNLLIAWLVHQPIPLPALQKSPQCKLRCDWKELVINNKRYTFHLSHSGSILATEHKTQILQQRTLLLLLKSQWMQEPGTKTKIRVFLIMSQYHQHGFSHRDHVVTKRLSK